LEEGLDLGKERFDVLIIKVVMDLYSHCFRTSGWRFSDCTIPQILHRWPTSGLRTARTGKDYNAESVRRRAVRPSVRRWPSGLPTMADLRYRPPVRASRLHLVLEKRVLLSFVRI
jgi:hypothetical protein